MIRATVSNVVEETVHCRSYDLALPGDGRASLDARPGQFVTLRVEVGGAVYDRCYSLSSVAELGEPPRVTVKRLSGGTVSAWIVEQLAVGDTIEIGPPAGGFFVRPGEGPLLFAAAGSGVTPIYAMIRAALYQSGRSLALLYVNRAEADAIFLKPLRRLRDTFASRMNLVEIYGGSSSPVLDPAVAGCFQANADADIYICGPASFMDRMEAAAEAAGFPPDRIYTERFVAAARIDEAPDATTIHAVSSAADVVATLSGLTHSFRCAQGMTLLEAALVAGLPAPSSCREGHCGACITTLCEGAVESAPGAALSRRDRQKGRILACRSRPTTPSIIIDYDA
jgi:3-ketosteroid 9alpha-monooxygenase subunit B